MLAYQLTLMPSWGVLLLTSLIFHSLSNPCNTAYAILKTYFQLPMVQCTKIRVNLHLIPEDLEVGAAGFNKLARAVDLHCRHVFINASKLH